ncbi:MAG TPA: DsbA family oxidoreductase [Polyangiaceae bacterium]
MTELEIHVWSDIACPWCYVGKRRLEAALALSDRTLQVNWIWRSFELNPSAPREEPVQGRYSARLARKYGITERDADERIAHLVETGRACGLDFNFDVIRPSNTFDAHRVLHLAKARGLQMATKERFLRAYFTEGACLSDPDTLIRLASEAGLKAEELRVVINSDAFALQVRDDETEARELGIHGVPFFLFADKYAVSGAQPVEVLQQAIERVEQELAADAEESDVSAVVCDASGCHTALLD